MNDVIIERGSVKMTVSTDASLKLYEITYKFGVDLNECVPKAFHVRQAQQWNIYYKTSATKEHTITVNYNIE